MSLRIRRGLNSQRTSVVLDTGEIAWATDTKKLYVGDGSTSGGVNILASSVDETSGLSWDNTTQKIKYTGALGTALSNVVEDTSPELGGNLNLNNQTINGTGNINFTGTMTSSGAVTAGSVSTTGAVTAGTISANTVTAIDGLGANLPLNSRDITGFGNINITGNVTSSNLSTAGTLTATTGLGANLPLNSRNITGTGNINITGNITASGTVTAGVVSANTVTAIDGLGANLPLNSRDITGTGNINITGTITSSGTLTANNLSTAGTLTATTGLGANLPLNSRNITGTGNINITGDITATTITGGVLNVDTNLATGGIKIDTNNSNLDVGFDLLTINSYYNTSTFPASMVMTRARGTRALPAAVQAGDVLGAFTFFGYTDPVTPKPAALVSYSAIAPITTGEDGIVPGQVEFKLSNSLGNLDTALTINAANGVVAGKSITPGVYATTTARNSAITSPQPGMMVYVTADSKFYGYVDDAGSAVPGWVALN